MKVGIIGCGLIGGKRAEAAMKAGHKVVAVADPDQARAKALSAKTGAEIRDAGGAIHSESEMIVIATPHHQLASLALEAVEAGKHVLVEKPAGVNATEIKKVADSAKARNVKVKVGFNHRFHPAFLKAYEIFKGGALGELMYIRARYGHGGRPGMEKEWRCEKSISGGGELIDQGSHLIDLSRWFLGELVLDYAALPTYYWPTKVEDNCFLALKNKQGALAWLHATWTEWKNTFSFEISGRGGKLVIEGLGGSYGTERLSHYHMLPEMGPPETTIYEFPQADRSWEVEFREFTAAIAENRKPVGDIEDAAAMLAIIEAAYAMQNEKSL